MSKYHQPYLNPASKPRPWKIHPIWRGIGCLLLILLPIIAFAAAKVLVQENFRQHWVSIPEQLAGSMVVPSIGRVFYTDLAVTIILIVIGFGLLTVLYAMVYRLFGPPTYGPLDAPPQRRG
jgi:hypothetical protein